MATTKPNPQPPKNVDNQLHVQGFTNTNGEWLIYESLFNHAIFRHTYRPLQMGAYRIPLVNTKIVMRSSPIASDAVLTQLRQAFFPDIPTNALLQTCVYRPWLTIVDPTVIPVSVAASVAAVAAAKALIVTTRNPPLSAVVMPYNFAANDGEKDDHAAPPLAIGTDPIVVGGIPFVHRLKPPHGKNWPMWQTASRSCVVRLNKITYWTTGNAPPDDPIVPRGVTRHPLVNGAADGNSWYTLDWAYRRAHEVTSDRANFEAQLPLAIPELLNINDIWKPIPDPDGNQVYPDYLSVANLDGCYSIKAGVMYVGSSQQASKDFGKFRLDKENILASLRSEYILALDAIAGRDSSHPDDLLILLPEILTVTAVDLPIGTRPDLDISPGVTQANPIPAFDFNGDGFQLRDLTQLDRTKRYFPPFSAIYIGIKAGPTPDSPPVVDLTTLADRYERLLAGATAADIQQIVADTATGTPSYVWAQYWKTAYAEKLAEAKALLLLRYGLQSLSPNSQNFLLEYGDNMVPTGRVVIRDLGDLRLHTNWVWTLFAPLSPVPPTGLKNVPFVPLLVPPPVPIPGRNPVLELPYRQLLTFETVVLPAENDPLLANPNRSISDRAFWAPQETGGAFATTYPDLGKAYPPGTQLNWFAFSALTQGGGISSASKFGTDPDLKSAGWQRILAVNAWWGIAHTRAFVAYLESALPGITVPIGDPPAPADYVTLAFNDYDGGEALNQKFLDWESNVATAVHTALFFGTGPLLLLAYHHLPPLPPVTV
ncbi:hypothetical protein JAAARDRAFT_31397 [Jaapia argillacea MUCL 33604]|uniref:Uncharacterized protein n=1 Tax=Jaapia argillacea MUCL 33604 TaxID=933084 RepID=A0A067Q4B9_9AGAM|nr:hypothetical protein JAAARDRAFT_31397 [Jaapia argillacea MUCL 33604]